MYSRYTPTSVPSKNETNPKILKSCSSNDSISSVEDSAIMISSNYNSSDHHKTINYPNDQTQHQKLQPQKLQHQKPQRQHRQQLDNNTTSKIHVRKLAKSESQTHLYRLQQLRDKYASEKRSLRHSQTDSSLIKPISRENMNTSFTEAVKFKLTPKRKGIQVLPPLPPDYGNAILHTPPRNSSPKYERRSAFKE